MKKIYSYAFLFFYLFYAIAIGHYLHCRVNASPYQKIIDNSDMGWISFIIYITQIDLIVFVLFIRHFYIFSNAINYTSAFLVVLSYTLHLNALACDNDSSNLAIAKDIILILATIVVAVFRYANSNRYVTSD